MQKSEKRLATILAAALGLWFLVWLFEGWILAPINAQRGLLTSAQNQLTEREEREVELYQAQSNLRDWRYESLPSDQLTAQRKYQEWLLDLAAMSGFIETKLQPGRRNPAGATYVQISVPLTARATLEQVARFLYLCDRAALLHRMDSLELTSPASDGNPLLGVKLTAAGLSLPGAEDRPYLFPRTTLTSDVSADGTTLEIKPAEGFPLVKGFLVKLGEELATVQQLNKTTWTVERGVESTLASAHAAGSDVELFPVDQSGQSRSFEDYQSLLENSPFTKPSPPVEYNPQFNPQKLPVVTRGTPWEVKLAVTGWNASGGDPVYSLGDDAPDGMTLDPKTGQLSWNPGADVPIGEYNVSLRAYSRVNSEQRLAATVPVTLREPNLPPVIDKLKPIRAYSGRPITLIVPAKDPDGDEKSLSFSLTDKVPDGAKIDPKTGELTWTPPLTLDLGDYPITISVTDKGDPPQTVTQKLDITVAEDKALFTRYSGYLAEQGPPTAFLYNQATKEKHWVHAGETLQLSEIKAEIVSIEPKHLDLKFDSQTFRLPLGSSFRQLQPVGDSASPPPDDAL